MKKVGIIGHFAFKNKKNDGQTVKTNEIYGEIKKNIEFKINVVDTQNWKKRIFIFVFKLLQLFKNSDYIVIIVASGGAKVLIPLLTFLNKFCKKKICFCVVGSWLDNRAKQSKILKKSLKRLDLILVETRELKDSLSKMGINNIGTMYNFKKIYKSQKNVDREPNTFCTFSRVMKQKGIEDAIYAIKKLNNDGFRCKLDIYGPIEKGYENKFFELVNNSGENINYCGNVSPNRSIDYISKYYMLIFPTHYIKEGLPGTIIDAFFSATPVISSEWLSAKEFISSEVGYTYKFGDKDALYDMIKYCILNSDEVEKKRKNTVIYCKLFEPKRAIIPLLNFINE